MVIPLTHHNSNSSTVITQEPINLSQLKLVLEKEKPESINVLYSTLMKEIIQEDDKQSLVDKSSGKKKKQSNNNNNDNRSTTSSSKQQLSYTKKQITKEDQVETLLDCYASIAAESGYHP